MKKLNKLGIPENENGSVLGMHKMQSTRYVRVPFSEDDILELQDLFLSNGVHYIKVDDIQSGRFLMQQFLQSLDCYHNVACLSTSIEPLDPSVVDLYSELMVGGYFDKDSMVCLEEFFLAQFNFDFLWLESLNPGHEASWLQKILKHVKNFKLEHKLPIIFVSYNTSI
jgi:hypothetical protein